MDLYPIKLDFIHRLPNINLTSRIKRPKTRRKIFTIGHSNRTLNAFIKILIENRIKCLVDVRSYPASRAVPQFNKARLAKSLEKYGITYTHLSDLGGRRRVKTDIHSSIEAPSFAGYADHMATDQFKRGLKNLKRIASKCRTAIMCAEAVWWRCHRRMISDRLEFDGWDVYHLGIKKDPIDHEIWDIARLSRSGQILYNN